MTHRKIFLLLFALALFFAASSIAGTTNYEYDDLHRLTRVERSDGTVTVYEYDNLGNRVSKEITATGLHTVTAIAGANGSITPSGEVAVADYGDITFTITAASSYALADLEVDGVSVLEGYVPTNGGMEGTYTFQEVIENHSIEVSFYQLTGLVGDMDGDCVVSWSDYNFFLNNWGKLGYNPADLDQDGTVSWSDYNDFLNNWGETCP